MRSLAVLLVLVAACESNLEAKVGGAILPQAAGVVPAPAAPVVVVKAGQPVAPLPPGPVRLAIDARTPWSQVRPLLDGAAATGSQPILLVGQRHRVRGFVLDDPRERGLEIRLEASGAGRFCLSPPDSDERYCVDSGGHRHISTVYVREAIAKAVREYGMTKVRVRPTDDLAWADLVRTVDGARTCCKLATVQVTVAR